MHGAEINYDDLLPPVQEHESAPGFMGVKAQPTLLKLSDIGPNRWNPHKMTEQERQDLEASVLEDGQWRPILVVRLDQRDESMDDDDWEARPEYRIVDGEHLFHALTSLYLSGKHEGYVSTLVLGNNSEIPVWKQQEIGQTMNHGLRGSQEDPDKTRQVLDNMLKYRKPEVIAKRMGLGLDGVEHLSRPNKLKPPMQAKLPVGFKKSTAPVRNQERKNYTIALVFEQADDLKSFEERVLQAADELGLERSDYQGKAGQFRIVTLTEALELAINGPTEPVETEEA